MFLNFANSSWESLPKSAILFSLFRVTILSVLMIESILKLLILLGFNTISLRDILVGRTELIADTTKSLYLSSVSVITTTGLTFLFCQFREWERDQDYISNFHFALDFGVK
jgi:hypothetical protein